MNALRRMPLLVVLAGSASLAFCGAGGDIYPAADTLAVEGIALGRSSLNDILYELGSPQSISLAGSDSEHAPSPDDPVVLRYESSYTLHTARPSEFRLYLNPVTNIVEAFSITFMNFPGGDTYTVPLSEIEAVFGKQYRQITRRLVPDEDDLEAVLSDCHDPDGEVASLLYQDQGLEVWIDDTGAATGLRFAIALVTGEETVEPCDSQAVSGAAARKD